MGKQNCSGKRVDIEREPLLLLPLLLSHLGQKYFPQRTSELNVKKFFEGEMRGNWVEQPSAANQSDNKYIMHFHGQAVSGSESVVTLTLLSLARRRSFICSRGK